MFDRFLDHFGLLANSQALFFKVRLGDSKACGGLGRGSEEGGWEFFHPFSICAALQFIYTQGKNGK